MAEELNRSLTLLAERGTPRGAANVLAAARAEESVRPLPGRSSWRRGLVVAAVTAVTVLVLLSAALILAPFGGGETSPATFAPPVVTAPPIHGGASVHPLNEVEALALGAEGDLWAATGGGVVRWDLTSGRPTAFGEPDGVPSSSVHAVDVAPDGTVWVAGDGWIASYDGSWRLFSQQNTPQLDSDIVTLGVDSDGVVWVDVASEPPLRYDGAWTQNRLPPPGVWTEDSDSIVGEDGTVWTPAANGITGYDGTATTSLVVPPEIATQRQPSLTLTRVEDALQVATAIGDFEFTTLRLPTGHSFFATAATPHGPVAIEGFSLVRWPTDDVTWEGMFPAVEPWRATTSGDDLIVYGEGYVRLTWDGNAWIETSIVELPGSARYMAFGARGTVALIEDTVYYAADGVTFAQAEVGPDREMLAGDRRSCVMNGPSSHSTPPQPQIGPVLATEAGFVLVTPAHPDNWSRTPPCEPVLWFSPDGSSWELVSPMSPFGERAIVHRIAEYDGRFVAVGATPSEALEGAAWVSTDGLSWQRANIAAETAVGVAGGELGWIITGSAGQDDGGFPAVDMWFSADGLTWDGPLEAPPALATFYFLPELAVGTDAIYGVGGTHDTYVIGRLQE